MLIRIPGINTTTKKNPRTGETKYYYYHRKTGARLPDDPKSPEFSNMVERLDSGSIGAPPVGRTFKALIAEYLKSPDFGDLVDSTKAEYRRHIRYMEPVLGGFPVKALRARHVEAIKQKYHETSTLAKAIARTLSVLFGYAAYPLEWIAANPLVMTILSFRLTHEEPEMKGWPRTPSISICEPPSRSSNIGAQG